MPPDVSGGAMELSVSDFVALHNQILEYALPHVTIVGELANFRVSKNKWVYFDLKDEIASVRFFGTVYALGSPLEDGMLLRVQGIPRLHPQFGFSINIQTIQPAGEGSLKKAFDLLQTKLQAEGLFDPLRKRPLPHPPERIGLITSGESAAYADFIKVLNARWSNIEIVHADTQVQGEAAAGQIVQAITELNAMAMPPEVIIITRGGGSSDDLWAFSSEPVVRAVAASRIPTLVAIGHEVDTSLAELAADLRASTPSNAAELLTPDRREVIAGVAALRRELNHNLSQSIHVTRQKLRQTSHDLLRETESAFDRQSQRLALKRQMLELVDPARILRRGYAILRDYPSQHILRNVVAVKAGQAVSVELQDGTIKAEVQ